MNKSLVFEINGREVCQIENDGLENDFHVPHSGDYFEFISTDKKGKGRNQKFRVHSTKFTITQDWSLGTLVQRLEISVNLRRLHHHAEWGNQFEPSGMGYIG